ncbi:MAG TPA: DUF6529 family protein [Pseudonocardia sp.]|nr:DUF6529 family protein [Pseudonocardia sp.]
MNTEPDPPTAPLPLTDSRSTTGSRPRPDPAPPSAPPSEFMDSYDSPMPYDLRDSYDSPESLRPPASRSSYEAEAAADAPTGAIPTQPAGAEQPRAEGIRPNQRPSTAGSARSATQTIDRAPEETRAVRPGSPRTGGRPTGNRPGSPRGGSGRKGPSAATPRAGALLVPVLVGAVVAVALGVYGRLHEPAAVAVSIAGFSSLGYVKAWLATATVLFGLLQLASSMVMYGRVVVRPPSWVAGLHRWSGRIAVLVSVPVAVQCLYALGFESGSTRVWVHSILGCLFYGAFTTKMLSLSRPGTPRWAVPLIGGLVFAGLIGLWLTSALWLFSTRGVHL